jgi:L-alanine-DL-glutamate epimerase-like enolase superfamily enzyme
MSATSTRITRVETIPLRILFRKTFKIAQGAARQSAEIFIVRLHTDSGISGVGEIQARRRQGAASWDDRC